MVNSITSQVKSGSKLLETVSLNYGNADSPMAISIKIFEKFAAKNKTPNASKGLNRKRLFFGTRPNEKKLDVFASGFFVFWKTKGRNYVPLLNFSNLILQTGTVLRTFVKNKKVRRTVSVCSLKHDFLMRDVVPSRE